MHKKLEKQGIKRINGRIKRNTTIDGLDALF